MAARAEPGSTGELAGPASALYPRLLGDEWPALPEAVRQAHCDGRPKRLAGVLDVELGAGRRAGLLRWLLRLPRQAGPAATTLEITTSGAAEIWSRRIGAWRLVSREAACAGALEETVGPLVFTFRLSRDGEALRYRQMGLRLRLLGLSLPVPPRLRLSVDAIERPTADGSGTHLHVRLSVPGGLLLAYHGDLEVQP